MIRTRLSRVRGLLGARVLMAVSMALGLQSCAGPQPLRLAIRLEDEERYVSHLNAVNGDPATAYANWMAAERNSDAADVLREDKTLSTTRNPFSAHRDLIAVSRGAVLYKIHCARCHAEDARGHGPYTLSSYPATDFKTVGKRLSATLHGGAPRKWFRVIGEGSGEVVDYPDGPSTAMPAFGDKLTREQIWLVITYLQSLDVHAQRLKE